MKTKLRTVGSLLAILLVAAMAGCAGTDESSEDDDGGAAPGAGATPPTGISAPNPFGGGQANQTANESATNETSS